MSHEDRTDDRIKTTFDRGRPFTLFQGSHSRVILAHLSMDQQQRLFLQHADDVTRVGLVLDWIGTGPSFAIRYENSASAELLWQATSTRT